MLPAQSITSVWRWTRPAKSPRRRPGWPLQGLAVEPEPGAICCYARQDKVWARDPDGVDWEHYTVLEHTGTP